MHTYSLMHYCTYVLLQMFVLTLCLSIVHVHMYEDDPHHPVLQFGRFACISGRSILREVWSFDCNLDTCTCMSNHACCMLQYEPKGYSKSRFCYGIDCVLHCPNSSVHKLSYISSFAHRSGLKFRVHCC